jgi:hypothetical protein
MTAPHYINENKSDMRGIKPGWYAVEDDGNFSSGPFSTLEACVARITQPTNKTMHLSCSEGRTEPLSLYRHPALRAATGDPPKSAL